MHIEPIQIHVMLQNNISKKKKKKKKGYTDQGFLYNFGYTIICEG